MHHRAHSIVRRANVIDIIFNEGKIKLLLFYSIHTDDVVNAELASKALPTMINNKSTRSILAIG